MKKQFLIFPLAVLCLIILTSCEDDEFQGGYEISTFDETSNSRVMVINGVSENPNLYRKVAGVIYGTPRAEPITFENSYTFTDYFYVDPNTDIDVVDGNLIASNLIEDFPNLALQADTTYSMFVTGSAANGYDGFVFTDDLSTPISGNGKVRFGHMSQDAPALDVYDAADTSTILFNNVAYGDMVDFLEIGSGDKEFLLAIAGTTNIIGSIELTVAEGRIYTMYMRGLVSDSTLASAIIGNN